MDSHRTPQSESSVPLASPDSTDTAIELTPLHSEVGFSPSNTGKAGNGSIACSKPSGYDRYSWLVAMAGLCAFATSSGLMNTFSMYYAPLRNEFGSSRPYTAVVGSVQNGVYMLAGPLATFVIQRIGLRPAIMLSGVITCTGYALSSLAPDLNILLITYGIIAASGCCLNFAGWVQALQSCCKIPYSLAFSLAQSGIGIGLFIFGQFYYWLIQEYGWRGSLLITGSIAFHFTLFGSLLLRVNPPQTQSEISTKNKSSLFIAARPSLNGPVAWALYMNCFFTMLSLLIVYILLQDAIDSMGLQDYYVPFFSVMGAGDLIGRLATGLLIEYCGLNPVILNLIAQVVSCLSILAFLVVYNGIQLLAQGLIFSTAVGVQYVLLAIVPRTIFGSVDKIFGIILFFGGVGILIGSPIAGWLADQTGSYVSVFFFSAFAELVAVISCLLSWHLSKQ